MKRWFLTIFLFWCIGMAVWASYVTITKVPFPERIRSYLDEYDTAQSVIPYLTTQQGDEQCKFELLPVAYGQDYALICLLNNVFDGSWHLLVDVSDEAIADRKTIVVMRDSSIIHHQDRHGRDARSYMSALIPHVERRSGEYIVHVSIVSSSEESTVTWRFHTDDLPMGEE